MLKSDKDTFQKLDAEAWGHSVYDLLASLQEKFNVEERLLEYALELDKAYIPTRYPNAHPSMSPRRRYTRVEAERLIGYAEVIRVHHHLYASQFLQEFTIQNIVRKKWWKKSREKPSRYAEIQA
jgi:hypothetical protein